jgi:hypothetical protein
MNLSEEDFEHRPEADRREVDLPVQVETATWSRAGQLDWWVKDRQNGGIAYADRMAVNAGSELLTSSHERLTAITLLSFIAGRRASPCRNRCFRPTPAHAATPMSTLFKLHRTAREYR